MKLNSRRLYLIAISWMALALCSPALADTQSADKPQARQILGWVESIRVEPWGWKMRARLDTGAKTASMSARNLRFFEKDDEPWVHFTFDFKRDKGEPMRAIDIERRIVRTVKIKRHGGKTKQRPVIRMQICLANHVHSIEFSLADRRSLNYPILLGREALENIALVDPAHTFLSDPDCGHKKRHRD